MYKNVRVTLNHKGMKELLKSDEINNEIQSKANEIKERLPEGYTIIRKRGKNRTKAVIATKSRTAMIDNQNNNTLIKAVTGK